MVVEPASERIARSLLSRSGNPACGAAGIAGEIKLVFFLTGKIPRSMQRGTSSRMQYFFIMLNFIKKNKAFYYLLLDRIGLI